MNVDGTSAERSDQIDSSERGPSGISSVSQDGLLGRIEVIEAQPLDERATRFDQVYEELLAELQAGDGIK